MLEVLLLRINYYSGELEISFFSIKSVIYSELAYITGGCFIVIYVINVVRRGMRRKELAVAAFL
jgi:hypothetical protein